MRKYLLLTLIACLAVLFVTSPSVSRLAGEIILPERSNQPSGTQNTIKQRNVSNVLYIVDEDGTVIATIDATSGVSGPTGTFDDIDINGGSIDGTDIGAAVQGTIKATSIAGSSLTIDTNQLVVNDTSTGGSVYVTGGNDSGETNFAIHDGTGVADFVVKGDGKVGMGTTSPDYTLSVNGGVSNAYSGVSMVTLTGDYTLTQPGTYNVTAASVIKMFDHTLWNGARLEIIGDSSVSLFGTSAFSFNDVGNSGATAYTNSGPFWWEFLIAGNSIYATAKTGNMSLQAP